MYREEDADREKGESERDTYNLYRERGRDIELTGCHVECRPSVRMCGVPCSESAGTVYCRGTSQSPRSLAPRYVALVDPGGKLYDLG